MIQHKSILASVLYLSLITSRFANSGPPESPSASNAPKSHPVKIVSLPRPPGMDVLNEIGLGSVIVKIEIAPSGVVSKSEVVNGYYKIAHVLKDFVNNTRFAPTQDVCNGPWVSEISLSVKLGGHPRTRQSAQIQMKILSAWCTNQAHECSKQAPNP